MPEIELDVADSFAVSVALPDSLPHALTPLPQAGMVAQVAALGTILTVVVVLVVLWCFPGLLGELAASRPRWKGWHWDGKE